MVDSQANCNIRKSSGFPSSNEHFKGEQVNSNKVSYIVQSVGKCFNIGSGVSRESLILHQTEVTHPCYLRAWMITPPSPLSEGLRRPLIGFLSINRY